MAFHPDITRKDTVSLALDTADAAVRIASKQLTGNAGTVEIPNADGTSTIMGVGAGDSGVAPWVGDTTAPGKPLGITAESHNGAVWVSWDGTLDGGIPNDWGHVQFTAVDGSKTVDMGQLTAAGKVTAAELTAGDRVTITAIAYDNAHAADGSSAPNASVASDPVTVVVQSAVDAAVVKKAQDDAQSALDKVGQASDTATAAKTTADGANTAASNAQVTATSANKAAQSAQTIANDAKDASAEAKQAAIDAQTAATNAKTAAQTAQTAAENANSAATSATTKADSASSAATQARSTATAAAQAATSAQTAANLAIANAENYVKNPQFHGSNLDSVRNTQMDASDSNAGILPAAASTYGKNTGGYDCVADAVRIRAIAGHTYCIEIDSKPASDMPSTETGPFGLMYWAMTFDNPGITSDQYTFINTTATTVTDWTHSKMEFTYAGTEPWSVFRPAYRANPGQRWLVTNFACRDITDAKAAQDAAKTAQDAADNAQTAAANAASIANTAKAAAQGAQTTADGKNKIFSSASEPAHTGLVPGDLWFQLNSSNHVTGIQTWNGSRFVDYLVVANEILVAGSVGTTQIANGAITTDLLTSNAVTAIKIAAQTITGDKLNVGSVASAIITSGLFKTADSGARVTIDSTGIKAYDANGNVTFQVDSATGKATMVGGMATGVSGQNRAVVEYNNQNQQGQFKIIGSDDAPIFFIDGGQSSTSRYADLMVANHNGVNPAIHMSNTGAVSVETSIEIDADEVSLNKHDLTSRERCVCNWENSWSGVSTTGSGYLEDTLKFSMSRGWYLVEAYVRTDGVGKEYHLDMLAKRTNGTLMDTWAMNLPMPSRGIGNMICSQMVYVDDREVDLAAQLYSRDYGSRPELFVDNDGKWSLDYPKRALSRYFRIFAM